MNICKTIATLLAVTLTSATTQASLSVDMFQPVDFPGWKVYQFFWDGGGTVDWTSAGMVVDLSQGDVYNYPYPDNRFVFEPLAIFPPPPEELYDTWIGPEGASVAGGAGDLGGGPQSLEGPQISVSWFITSTGYNGHIQIAQVTVSNDAMGTWKIISAGEMLEGVITPEPASLALFGLAIPALLRRQH